MKRTVQSILMLIALWGALLTIALREGWEMPVWLTPAERPTQPQTPRPSPPTTTPEPSEPAATPSVDELEAPTAPELARYRVCRGVSPVLSRVQLSDNGLELAVHCGDTLHLIALHDGAPQRIARIVLTSPSPAEVTAATAIASADVNADRLTDLVIPWLTVNAWKHPVGRSVLILLRDPNGGFRPALRMLSASPLQLAVGTLDGQPGADIVLLQATDESVHKPRQAWWVSGGNPPKRVTTSELAPHSEAIALADLDRDGHSDVIAASLHEGRIDVAFGNGDATAATTLQLQAAGCHELFVADLTGDAHDDLICAGDNSYVIEARTDRSLTVQTLSLAGEQVRSLQAADLNADGKLDLVGYAHPQLVQLEQGAAFHFEPRLIAELQGATFAPLSVHLADLDHDNRLDLAMLGRAPNDAEGVDLVIVSDVSHHVQLTVSADGTALSDARLLLTPTVP